MTFQIPEPSTATTTSAKTIRGNESRISMSRCVNRSIGRRSRRTYPDQRADARAGKGGQKPTHNAVREP